MKSQSTWVALLAVGAVAVGIWLIAKQPPPDARPAVPADVPARASPASTADLVEGPVARGSFGAPSATRPASGTDATATDAAAEAQPALPPLDAPLASIVDALEARARAGDARAACRLASELARCSALPRRRAFSAAQSRWMQQRSTQVDDEAIESVAHFEVSLEEDERICANVPVERTREATPWLLRAARAGQPAAQAAFVSGAWILSPTVVRHADAIAAYAREAEPMARGLLESSAALDPDLLMQMGLAFAGDDSRPNHLTQVVVPDPVLARAALGLAREAQPPSPVRPGVDAPLRNTTLSRQIEALDVRLTTEEQLAVAATMDRLRPRVATVDRSRRFGLDAQPDPADCAR